MFNFPTEQTLTYSAGGSSQLTLDYLHPRIDKLHNHITGLLLQLDVNITPHASNVDAGRDVCKVIQSVELRDRLGNRVLYLLGHELRDALQFFKGGRETYGTDPADTTAGGGAEDKVAYYAVPFRGGPGGLLGLRNPKDAWQPVARFLGGQLTVNWSAAAANDLDGAVNSATLKVTPQCVADSRLILGADFRLEHFDGGSGGTMRIPSGDDRIVAVALSQATRTNLALYATIGISKYSLLEPTSPARLMQAFLASGTPIDRLAPTATAPDYVPVLFPQGVHPSFGDHIGDDFNELLATITVSSGTPQHTGLRLALRRNSDLATGLRQAAVNDFGAYGRRVPLYANRRSGQVATGKQRIMATYGPSELVA